MIGCIDRSRTSARIASCFALPTPLFQGVVTPLTGLCARWMEVFSTRVIVIRCGCMECVLCRMMMTRWCAGSGAEFVSILRGGELDDDARFCWAWGRKNCRTCARDVDARIFIVYCVRLETQLGAQRVSAKQVLACLLASQSHSPPANPRPDVYMQSFHPRHQYTSLSHPPAMQIPCTSLQIFRDSSSKPLDRERDVGSTKRALTPRSFLQGSC